jgi:pyrroline-5-carboxylate reductase
VSERPDIVVLAVKPQSMDAVLPDLKRFADEGSVFLSIAAGKTLKYFAAYLGPAAKVVRSMPNTPAAVRQGITVATTAKDVSAAEKKRCHDLLEAVGQVLWVDDEALMDRPMSSCWSRRWRRPAPSSGWRPRWPCSLRARRSRGVASC